MCVSACLVCIGMVTHIFLLLWRVLQQILSRADVFGARWLEPNILYREDAIDISVRELRN
jgi:hypothetical protein